MSDALSNFNFGSGTFIKLNAATSPRKLRVVTTDPVVSLDNFGNTRFSFVAWDYNDDRAGILSVGPGVAKRLQAIHQDEDFGANIKNTDIKVETVGSELDTRHTVTALPKSQELSPDQIKKLRDVDLDGKIENGQRMTVYNPDDFALEEKSGYDKAKETRAKLDEPDEVVEDIGDEPINLDDIPF